MALIAGTHYDPSSAATKATTALLAMTAVDTTNLRLTFNMPTTGSVLVRIRCAVEGNASAPNVLLGILEGSTVVARQAGLTSAVSSAVAARNVMEAMFVVSGVTAGSHSWDAAYGVEVVQTTSQIEYGGPNDTTTDNAWGGFSFEIWQTANLLGSVMYDPSTAVAKVLTSNVALAAFDTTNARITFTVPNSGAVLVKLRTTILAGTATAPSPLLGVLDGATVVGRCAPMGGRTNLSALVAGSWIVHEAEMLILGLVPGASKSYDAAFGCEVVGGAGTQIQYGGPDNTTTQDAWGALSFEVWAA